MIGSDALGRLRAAKAAAEQASEVREIMAARDEVLARYSPMFQPEAVSNISAEALRSFLYFENNRHWTGLNRQVNRICADMDTTRSALSALVDESLPIETRMEPATSIKGMGKGIITAILHVAYPNDYGVWNSTSEAGLVELDLMPRLPWGAKFGERYKAINDVLKEVASALDVDLWTLDAIWWRLKGTEQSEGAGPDTNKTVTDAAPSSVAFGLERHLHDFLFDNWDQTSLGKDWALFTRPGEDDAGYEFATPVGRIDLLARHRTEPRWLVIELKRTGDTDKAVGQALRYIGWVQAQLAAPEETVEGLIIARNADIKMHYAVSAAPNVTFQSYEVDFRLVPGSDVVEFAAP